MRSTNTFTSLQTALAAEAHAIEGQFLLEELTLNVEKPLIHRPGTRRPTISKTEGPNLESKVNSNKEQCIDAIPPLT
jgi:hypothetical protein